MAADFARYHRQMIFSGMGEAGQRKLSAAHVVIVGCGATGTVLANQLARAGVGHLTLVDRDFIELHNLQRQLLFDEQDLAANLPKAEAAARKLRLINSQITVEGLVSDVHAENIEQIIGRATMVLDGTDNFETRYLLNDACIKQNIPWIYTGVVSSYGMSQTIIPGKTACLRCLQEEAPPPGTTATCDTAGVVGPVVSVVASISAMEAIKLLVGHGDLNHGVIHVDLWVNSFEQFRNHGPRANCPACQRREFPFLRQEQGEQVVSLCGRDAVQIRPANRHALNLAALAPRLAAVSELLAQNEYLLRFRIAPHEITIFADGRAIIKGTMDETIARSLYARYIGN